MANARPKPPRLDLVVLTGPDEGLRARLDPPGPVPIGRSAKGFALTDPLVSIQHAELTFEEQEWRLRDVGSATGTRLGGTPLEKGEVRRLQLGDIVEVGESRIQISRPPSLVLPLLGALLFVVAVMAGTAFLALVQGKAASTERALTWHEPIKQGSEVAARLALSPTFLRQRGIDPSRLRIARVSDFDANGLDEVWLTYGREQLAVTFERDGSWVELARLPEGCIDGSRGGDNLVAGGFPLQRCPGRTYEHRDGAYRVSRQEGTVVWVLERPAAEAAATEPAADPAEAPPEPVAVSTGRRLVPYTVTSRRPEKLAGFLAGRGVSEPIAWLLCESAFPELSAQVRTARGAVRALSHGCHTDLRVEGQIAGDVVAVAFTAAAREALLDDLARYFAGNPDALFATPEHRGRLEAWRAEPGFLKGGTRVEFEGPEHFFHPMAGEGPLPQSPEPLFSSHGAAPAPPALTATLLTKGVAALDPPGCTRLELQAGDWSCAIGSGCVATSTFLTVREVGCGEPRVLAAVPYLGGVVDATVDRLEVRAVVDATTGADGTEVWQTRVGYRTLRP